MAVANDGIVLKVAGNTLVFRARLLDDVAAIVTTGTIRIRLQEYQTDGTFKSYDFNDNTFKTTALTTATLAMTHRTTNNATVNTGIWTAILATLTGFTAGGQYNVIVEDASGVPLAYPPTQSYDFIYGTA